MSTEAQYSPLQRGLRRNASDENEPSRDEFMMADRNLNLSNTPSPSEKTLFDGPSEETDRMTFRRVMVIIAMAFLWTASQIPLYFYGGIEVKIIDDIGGDNTYVWIALGNLLPLGIITPFVGALSDIFGRKIIGMASFFFVILGNIICSTAHTMNVFIIGCCFMGIGAGTGELIALAVAGEIAPTKQRGLYIGGMVMTILPFCPAVLYGQLLTYVSSWRWVGLIIGGWSFIGLMLTLIFYRPLPRQHEFTRTELLRRLDYVGGFLSATGITLFLVGLILPTEGATFTWSSPTVYVCIAVGGLTIIAFVIWEWRFAKHPMFPARLKEKSPRVLFILLLVTFVGGANFFAVLLIWPDQYQKIYAQNNAVSQGVGSLPVGFGVIAGSIGGSLLVSILKGKIKLLMIVSTAVMTAANGAMACATTTNIGLMYFLVSLACIGVGAVIVSGQVISSIVVPHDLLGTILAATISARILGGCIAYTVYYDVLSIRFDQLAVQYIVPAAYSLGINSTSQIETIVGVLQSGSYVLLLSYPETGVTTQAQVAILTEAAKQTSVESYQMVYYISIAFGGLAVIASCFLTPIEKLMGSEVAFRLE